MFQLGYRARETTVAGMPLYVSVGWPMLSSPTELAAELEPLARAVERCADEVAEERRRARRA